MKSHAQVASYEVPVWHTEPVYPSTQLHMNPVVTSWHVPPCWQMLSVHCCSLATNSQSTRTCTPPLSVSHCDHWFFTEQAHPPPPFPPRLFHSWTHRLNYEETVYLLHKNWKREMTCLQTLFKLLQVTHSVDSISLHSRIHSRTWRHWRRRDRCHCSDTATSRSHRCSARSCCQCSRHHSYMCTHWRHQCRCHRLSMAKSCIRQHLNWRVQI